MTSMLTEFEILEQLDFEFSPPCDNKKCDNEAEWRSEVSCCGHSTLSCTPCKKYDENRLRKVGSYLCWLCGGKNPHVDWTYIKA